MSRFKHIVILSALIAAGAQAQVGDHAPWSIMPESQTSEPAAAPSPVVQVIGNRSPLGLPGERPRLSMSMPLSNRRSASTDSDVSAFSWSLKAWQMNTASLAHIQCSQGTMTMNSYLAQDCRFVDQPLPSDSMNLLQVAGDWMAAPGLQLGVSAYRGDEVPARAEQNFTFDLDPELLARRPGNNVDGAVEGLDVNVSFGIQTERLGDFLVGLQLARYRQRLSLSELGTPFDEPLNARYDTHYSNSAQVLLGWRHGSFSGEMLGQHRELPLWLGSEQAPSTLNSFDLEFSWQAQRNASLSVGVSNIMDAAPRADEPNAKAALEEPLESVYGRIPYVRYKHDL